MSEFVAIIGDLKSSRMIVQRAEVQDLLHETLKRINEKSGDQLVSKFIITLGDEFQGLLARVDDIKK